MVPVVVAYIYSIIAGCFVWQNQKVRNIAMSVFFTGYVTASLIELTVTELYVLVKDTVSS